MTYPFRRTRLCQAIALVAGSATVATAAAQSTEVTLDPLSVWGTEIRASSVRISDEVLEIKQADHVSDLLRTIPGVDVGGAHSLNQRITIRSMDDKDLRISIDGANQNTYMYHHMGNLQIHADILQSVDVEVGNNSVIDGGLGGSVRFETKSAAQLLQPGQTAGGRVAATYGTNSGTNYSATGYGQITDKLDVLAYFNHIDRDDYEVGGGKVLDENGDEIPGTDGEVRGLAGDLDDALVKFGYDISDSQRVEIGYETYKDEGDYSYRPDMGLATDLTIADNLMTPLLWPTRFTRDTFTVNYDGDISDSTYIKAAVFRNDSELERDETGWAMNPAFASSAGTVFGEAINTGFNVLTETVSGRHTLTYGGEWIDYDTEYLFEKAAGGADASSENATNLALYVQDRIALTDRLDIIPGLRYNSFDIDSVVVDDKFTDTTGALALDYDITDTLNLRVSRTELFKGPEIGEVFIGGGLYDVANPDIDAETGANNEVSLAFSSGSPVDGRLAAGLTWFQTDVDDYIYDYAPAPAATGARSWKDNVGDLRIDGYEAYLGYDVGNLRTLLTYAKADSELDAAAGYADLDGARLDRTQGDTISFNLDYDLPSKDLSFHWDMLYVDDVPAGLDLDGATLDNAKDGFTVHNVSMRWMPRNVEGLSLIFGIDNVFDEFYASQSSRTGVSRHPRFGELYLVDYEPGRNFKFTVAYTF